jgi:DNA-binding NarL/FixJ family response regulator
VVDLGLPDGGGDLLVNELLALHPTLRIVVASGRSEIDYPNLQANPAISFLPKPQTPELLGSALQDKLSTRLRWTLAEVGEVGLSRHQTSRNIGAG